MLEPVEAQRPQRAKQTYLRVGCKKVLNRRDLVTSSGIEIGVLVSGFSPELSNQENTTASLPPVCGGCGAYISKYGAATSAGS
jgi:hypothetical protein